MSALKPRPYEVKPFTKEENEQFKNHLYMSVDRLLHVGEKGYTLPEYFMNDAEWIRNFQLRSDDVFIVSYPRSGSTWAREMVWLVGYDLDFSKAKSMDLGERVYTLE